MLEHVVIIGLILGAGYWIISPLLKPDQFKSPPISKVNETIRQLEAKKENAYAAIRELEFDFSMEKLSKEDVDTLKGQYRADALYFLKQIDTLRSDHKTDESPEEMDSENETCAEIFTIRKNNTVEEHNIFCVQCGTKISDPGRFCYCCGERLVSVS